MNTQAILVSILLTIVSQICSAQNLASQVPTDIIDLRRPGYSMESIPVLDQNRRGPWPLCYAYSAASMVDAFRLSKLHKAIDNHFTSPIYAALIENMKRETLLTYFNDPIDEKKALGGFMCHTYNSINKYGACLVSPQFTEKINAKAYIEVQKIYVKLVSQKNQLYKISSSIRATNQPKRDFFLNKYELTLKNYYQELNNLLMLANQSPENKVFTLDELRSIFLKSRNSIEFVINIFFSNCTENNNLVKLELPSCLNTNLPSVGISEQLINELLLKPNPLPIGIEYCGKLLTEGKKFNVNLVDLVGTIFKANICGAHASLIIGKRSRKDINNIDVKEYLIRNSWGQLCSYYSADWECEKNGDIWVDAESVHKSILAIQYLQ